MKRARPSRRQRHSFKYRLTPAQRDRRSENIRLSAHPKPPPPPYAEKVLTIPALAARAFFTRTRGIWRCTAVTHNAGLDWFLRIHSMDTIAAFLHTKKYAFSWSVPAPSVPVPTYPDCTALRPCASQQSAPGTGLRLPEPAATALVPKHPEADDDQSGLAWCLAENGIANPRSLIAAGRPAELPNLLNRC